MGTLLLYASKYTIKQESSSYQILDIMIKQKIIALQNTNSVHLIKIEPVSKLFLIKFYSI